MFIMLSQVIFPIQGPFQEPLLIMEEIVIFFALEFGFLFLIKYKIKKEEISNLQEKAFSWFCLGYSLMYIVYIISDYYVEDSYIRLILLDFAYFIQMIFGLLFIYNMEKFQIFFKKFLFTFIFIVFMILFVICAFIALEFVHTFSFFFSWIIYIIFFFYYMIRVSTSKQMKKILRNFKWHLFQLYSGFFFLNIGYALTTYVISNLFGLIGRLIGAVFQIIGLIFLSLYFLSISSITEYFWREKIDSIYIIMQSGLCLYTKHFREKRKSFDEIVASGALSSVQIILELITETKDLSIIEKEGKTMIFQPGEYIIGVLVCEEDLESIRITLKNFVQKIEKIYYNVLRTWDGNLNVFKPIEDIINEVFI